MPSDNSVAARTCLVTVVVAAGLGLLVCAVVLLGLLPLDILDEPATEPPDRRGTVASEAPTLTFAVLDIGQGMCVAVIAPDGGTMIIDGGRSMERMEQVVVPWLRERGVEEIDYVVLTHPDQDHVGGLPRLLELMPVNAWVDPVIPTTNQSYGEALQIVADQGIEPIKARRGLTLQLGAEVTATALWPIDPLEESGGEVETNNNSVTFQITYRDVTFLVPGDLEEAGELALIEMDENNGLQSDVLVTGHHGSKTSSSAEFLDIVQPSVAVIPVGFDNQYGHPHDEVLQRLRFRGITTYRTDLDGTVEIVTDGEQFTVVVSGPEGEE
jgi:competence protein ComEC